MRKETLKLALEALEYIEHNYMSLPAPAEKAITALREALAEQPAQDNTYGYAKGLAESLFKKHYAHEEHYASGRIVWEVSDTTIGLLTQIDNMVCTLVRPAEQPAQQEFVSPGGGYVPAIPAQQALDKKAENARELGLDYEPVCNKDPQDCWNVRCQLGKKCKNTPAQQEPVAWRAPNWVHSDDEWVYRDFDDPVLIADGKPSPNNEPLYTSPPAQRTWVGLTDEAIWLEYQRIWPFHPAEEPTLAKAIIKFARAIEAAHGIKEKNT